VEVLREIAEKQSGMGEALTVDSIVGSIDAEVLALGPSDKGPYRGAILRHGSRTLWGFPGIVEEMTPAGRALFLNVVAFAAKQGGMPVLEKRRNSTRDGLFEKLEFARRNPGYLRTLKRLYLPDSLADSSLEEIENWAVANRPFLRTEGRRFQVDTLARLVKLPNHRLEYLDGLVENLRRNWSEDVLAALRRSTGLDLGPTSRAWEKWLRENRDSLFFSDCDGFVFRVDEEAKARGIPTAKLRGWSSEEIDYRLRPERILGEE
jgi:hypothetical protein